MKILILSDYSYEECKGGAEAYDRILIKELNADFVKSSFFTSGDGYDKVILSNYWELNPIGREWLIKNPFFLVNHDHSLFPNRIPQENPAHLVNVDLHWAAQTVIFQSTRQEQIFRKFIELKNTYNLRGNLWSDEEFALFAAAPEKKNGKFAIPAGSSPSKGTQQAVELANYLRIPYEILPKMEYEDFISKLGEYSSIVLQPAIVESFGRQAAEARMMGLTVLTNSNMTCSFEEWYNWDRFEIIEEMKKKKKNLLDFLKN